MVWVLQHGSLPQIWKDAIRKLNNLNVTRLAWCNCHSVESLWISQTDMSLPALYLFYIYFYMFVCECLVLSVF